MGPVVRVVAVCVTVATLFAGGCGGDDDDATDASVALGGAPTVSTPTSAVALAPSQQAGSTVAPPTLPPRCDPADVAVVLVEPDEGVGQPDQIVDLVNEGDRECDVDISATVSAAAEMEPSVHLQPGGAGHVWIAGRGGCDESLADPPAVIDLDVNGEMRQVDLTFVSPCGVEVVAFFTD